MTVFPRSTFSLFAAITLWFAPIANAQDSQAVRFAVDAYTTGSQIWVAEDMGYFDDEGIDAQITTFATGVEAIDALLIGRADMAVGLDFPIVSRLQSGRLTVLAGIFHSTPGFHKLVVSNEIKKPADLVGKTVGIATGTAEHLITIKYLEENGISPDEVEIVGFSSLLEIVASLRAGRIDASFVWADGTERAISGGDHYVLTDDSAAGLSGSAYIAAATPFLDENPQTAVAVLRAIDRASQYITENPDKAAAIVADNTRAPLDTMRKLLGYNEFNLALTDYERDGFNVVADFISRSQDTPVNFETAVDPSFLQQAEPDSVKLSD